jgi:hypothetical protein
MATIPHRLPKLDHLTERSLQKLPLQITNFDDEEEKKIQDNIKNHVYIQYDLRNKLINTFLENGKSYFIKDINNVLSEINNIINYICIMNFKLDEITTDKFKNILNSDNLFGIIMQIVNTQEIVTLYYKNNLKNVDSKINNEKNEYIDYKDSIIFLNNYKFIVIDIKKIILEKVFNEKIQYNTLHNVKLLFTRIDSLINQILYTFMTYELKGVEYNGISYKSGGKKHSKCIRSQRGGNKEHYINDINKFKNSLIQSINDIVFKDIISSIFELIQTKFINIAISDKSDEIMINKIKILLISVSELFQDILSYTSELPLAEQSPKTNTCHRINIDNNANSCYIDSLFVALFHDDESPFVKFFKNANINKRYFTDKYKSKVKVSIKGNNHTQTMSKSIEDIKKNLIQIIDIILNNTLEAFACTDIRKNLQIYHLIKQHFINLHNEINDNDVDKDVNYMTSQQEPKDVLSSALFDMFELTDEMKWTDTKSVWGYNKDSSQKLLNNSNISKTTEKEACFKTINFNEYISQTYYEFNIEKLTSEFETIFDKDNYYKPEGNATLYQYKVEKHEYTNVNYLWVNFTRLNTLNEKINIIVKPAESLTFKNKTLYLRSIIVHVGGEISNSGHYICVYKCGDTWYEYNDAGESKKRQTKIGTFKNVKNFEKDTKHGKNYYLRNCTDLIYF